MMMTCETLQDISALFNLICICFLKNEIDLEFTMARKTLQMLISEKSELSLEISRVIK